jgi:hypothetical protein
MPENLASEGADLNVSGWSGTGQAVQTKPWKAALSKRYGTAKFAIMQSLVVF